MKSKMRVLVTGATGFIGSSLTAYLKAEGYAVVAATRDPESFVHNGVEKRLAPPLSAKSDWSATLQNIDIVIHAAALAHVKNSYTTKFHEVNTEGTLALAHQAIAVGVKRFIFISSIRVNGYQSNQPFKESDPANPQEAYAQSKYEAELGLLALAKESAMEIVIIRPPLVYGPNVQGNFANLLQKIKWGIPLPLGSIHNQRSLVAVENLLSFISLCIVHPKAENELFLISDGEDVSTTELLQKMVSALHTKTWLIPIPVSWMRCVAKVIGKQQITNRLFGSLQVDSSKAQNLLGWKSVISMDEQLAKIAKECRKGKQRFNRHNV